MEEDVAGTQTGRGSKRTLSRLYNPRAKDDGGVWGEAGDGSSIHFPYSCVRLRLGMRCALRLLARTSRLLSALARQESVFLSGGKRGISAPYTKSIDS